MIIKGNLKEILLWLHKHVGRLEPSNANTVSNLWKAAYTANEKMIIDHVVNVPAPKRRAKPKPKPQVEEKEEDGTKEVEDQDQAE